MITPVRTGYQQATERGQEIDCFSPPPLLSLRRGDSSRRGKIVRLSRRETNLTLSDEQLHLGGAG
jgi:hypothetical protein